MDPLNKKERTEAFIKMLLFFILTVALTGLVIFYAFRMPAKEQDFSSEAYSELLKQAGDDKAMNQEFLLLADSARSLYFQYIKENTEVNRKRLIGRFSAVLNQMEDKVQQVESDTVKHDLYFHLIDAYSSLAEKNDNIRSLKEDLKKAVEAAEGGGGGGGPAEPSRELTSDEKMIDLIKAALEKHNGNKKDAARDLGMTERSLRKKMQDLGM